MPDSLLSKRKITWENCFHGYRRENRAMIAVPLAKKIAELFLILFVSAALVKAGVLKAENSRVLSRLSIYFVTPCVVFHSFMKELTPETWTGLVTSAALAVCFQALFFLIAALLRRFWKASEVERTSVVFTNVGNLIIPLVAFVLGQDWVIYTSAYILVFNVLFWTVGVRMFDRESAFDLRKALLNPNILATVAGLILLFTRVKLPEPFALAFSDTAAMIGPLSMMITGMVVGGMTFRGMFANRRVFGVLFFRMILASGLAVFIAVFAVRTLSLDKAIVMIPLLGAIAPSASNLNQVAILYNKDARYASAINVLTTLSCIATIPLWIALYEALIR